MEMERRGYRFILEGCCDVIIQLIIISTENKLKGKIFKIKIDFCSYYSLLLTNKIEHKIYTI